MQRAIHGALIWWGIGLQGCYTVPDLHGVYLAHHLHIEGDQRTVDEIVSTFQHAEKSIEQSDLDGTMSFYARNYRHTNFNPVTLRPVWRDIFQQYRDLSITHVFSRIVIHAGTDPPTAEVTCTGSLWGTSMETGEYVNIDSWSDTVHYLIYEDGEWRTQGHQREFLMEKETRSMRPPHPLF
jgi:hypothetical protein